MLFRACAFAIVTLCSFSPVWAQEPRSEINVSGSAEVKVVPDEVYLRLGVETRDISLDAAKRQNDDRTEKILKQLKKKGVPEKNIQTDFMSVEPEYDYNVLRVKSVAYVVRKSVEVKLTELRRFEEVLTEALENGVTHVHGIDFRTSQLRKHRDEARAMAIRAAKEKADALAAELGVRRGKVQSINENTWGGWWGWSGGYGWGGRGQGMMQNAVQERAGASDVEERTLSVGQISVSATVNVTFGID